MIGSGGESLIDGDVSTSVTIPRTPEGVYEQFTIIVNDNCYQGNMFNIDVTVNLDTTCDLVRSAILIGKSSNCNRIKLDKCSVVTSEVTSGKTKCSVTCKYADSAELCQFHLYSVLNQQDLEIWEISTTTNQSQ